MTKQVCPTPDKYRYATYEAAEKAGKRSQILAGQILYPYACACSWWHCSKKAPQEVLTGTADLVDVERLASIPDIAFRGIVADELTGKATTADRLALRHPRNLQRWKRILGELHQDLQDQRTQRKHDTSLAAQDWRTRALRYEAQMQVAMDECRQLRADEHVRKMQQPRTVIDLINEHDGPINAKELRRLAGEAAIHRLIEAHRSEFSALLAEECARIGVTAPKQIRKHLIDHDLPATA